MKALRYFDPRSGRFVKLYLDEIVIFINYSLYSNYKIKMDTTTIQLSKKTRDKISSLGRKGESYEEIIARIYSIAVKEQLREFLLSSEDTISIEEARKELSKKWSR